MMDKKLSPMTQEKNAATRKTQLCFSERSRPSIYSSRSITTARLLELKKDRVNQATNKAAA
jgi:hypothetical protein